MNAQKATSTIHLNPRPDKLKTIVNGYFTALSQDLDISLAPARLGCTPSCVQ
jgi:hypothetical protein